ncbi:MAG TPA: hypothetical protein PKH65_02325 [Bacteroidia bacterium]|nr:hypothetical protein [Bacteroidia bacterium]
MQSNGKYNFDDVQLAYYTDKIHQAAIYKAMLEEHQIPYKEINKIDSSYGTFGYIEFYVPESFLPKAKQLAIQLEQ